MAAGVWVTRDIANALLAAVQSERETRIALGGDPMREAMFRAGHRAAISTIALFFGLAPGLVLPEADERDDGAGPRQLTR
jgi:hypothetical protein